MTKESPKNAALGGPFQAITEAFRAGNWIVDPELNCLRSDSEERHIEPKVMKVLLVLASRPNHVVPKDEIMAAVWPETFVGDDVLTRCISVLRRVTHDSAQAPHFIQTIPKVGYRLVAEITALEPTTIPPPATHTATIDPAMIEPAGSRIIANADPISAASNPAIGLVSHSSPEEKGWVFEQSSNTSAVEPAKGPAETPGTSRKPLYLLTGTILLLAISAISFPWLRHASSHQESFRTLPFTSLAGEQWQPAFAPDGKSIAFAAVSGRDASRHLYVKQIGSDDAAQITFGTGEDFSPAWSSNGKRIAYLSRTGDQFGLYIVTLATRETRRVFIPQQQSQWEQGALSWSPDGKTLVFPDHTGSSPNSSLFELDLATQATRVLTTPPTGWEGDLTPAYSPDGQTIAFTRASETAVRDIYLVRRDGTAKAVTHDHSNIDSIAWTADGKGIVFSSNRGGKFALWQTNLSGNHIERLPVGTEDAVQPAIGPGGKLLAYAQGSSVWSILRITGSGSPTAVLSSTQQDSAPSLAPDGTRFAFQSQRSGFQEIWIARTDGTSLQQLTHQAGAITGSPSWSHGGSDILFDSRVDGHSHIFVIPSTGGTARQLTTGDANDIVPHWSVNDTAVYFRSNRGGRWQLWRTPFAGGTPQPITSGDGIAPQESPDGKRLYYTRGGEDGLWFVPFDSGEIGAETKVLDLPPSGFWGYYQVTPQGIFYLDRTRDKAAIRIFHPETGRSTLFAPAPLTTPAFAGLAVTADGKQAFLTDEARAGRHITLVQKGE